MERGVSCKGHKNSFNLLFLLLQENILTRTSKRSKVHNVRVYIVYLKLREPL